MFGRATLCPSAEDVSILLHRMELFDGLGSRLTTCRTRCVRSMGDLRLFDRDDEYMKQWEVLSQSDERRRPRDGAAITKRQCWRDCVLSMTKPRAKTWGLLLLGDLAAKDASQRRSIPRVHSCPRDSALWAALDTEGVAARAFEAFPTHMDDLPVGAAARWPWACCSCEVAATSGTSVRRDKQRP